MQARVAVIGLFLAAAFGAAPATAIVCEDFEDCTTNDMCADGVCVGTPVNGGACDDGNDCTINDACVAGTCLGSPAPAGTSCNQGCGTCFAPAPGFSFCLPDEGRTGQACDDGSLCTINDRCQFGACFGDFKCGGGSGDPCNFEACDPFTGACLGTSFDPCGDCGTCTPDPNEFIPFTCVPSSDGAPCDDFNECTGDGVCFDGDCVNAPPIDPNDPVATPTATRTAAPPSTPTPTNTVPAGNTPTHTPRPSACPGDCSGDGTVTVDEIITGVNIALGSLPVANCLAMDTNGDGEVTVDEILQAINAALNGCP